MKNKAQIEILIYRNTPKTLITWLLRIDGDVLALGSIGDYSDESSACLQAVADANSRAAEFTQEQNIPVVKFPAITVTNPG